MEILTWRDRSIAGLLLLFRASAPSRGDDVEHLAPLLVVAQFFHERFRIDLRVIPKNPLKNRQLLIFKENDEKKSPGNYGI